jgi:CheY-like chemotaxis protein
MASVLVVDDEVDYPQLLSIILSKEGFEVQTAASGQEATQRCERFAPDVLVVDWMLEGSDNGLDVAEALRTRHPKLQTILITGYPSLELEARVEQQPATRFLAKPFAPIDLVTMVREAVATL